MLLNQNSSQNLQVHYDHWASQMTPHPKLWLIRLSFLYVDANNNNDNNSWYYERTSYATKFEGSRRNRTPFTKKGGVEAVGLTEEKEEEKVHFPNPKTCWLPPHQPNQTNPVTFKSFESWGREEEEEEDEGEEEEEESKWQTWWQDLLKTWEKWSYDEGGGSCSSALDIQERCPSILPHSFQQNLLPLTVRRDVWGAAAIAVGSLGSFDVKVQQLHLQRNTNEMTVWWGFHSFGA